MKINEIANDKPWNNVFPDTGAGAIAALEAMTDLDLKGAKVIPDPKVDGVWMVIHNGHKAIVYLKGYKNPLGNVRDHNDFESEDEFGR